MKQDWVEFKVKDDRFLSLRPEYITKYSMTQEGSRDITIVMYEEGDFTKDYYVNEPYEQVEQNVYGADEELRLQCFGRYRKLAYTGLNDKNNRPLYEGHIVKVAYKICKRKIVFVGVIGFEKSEFVIIDNEKVSTSLSAYDPCDLKLVGNIFKNPEIMEVERK